MSAVTQEFATENYFFQKGYIERTSTFYICSKIGTTYYFFGFLSNQYGFYKNNSDATPVIFASYNFYSGLSPFSLIFSTLESSFLNVTSDNVLTVGPTRNVSFSLISKNGNFQNSVYLDDVYNMMLSGRNEILRAFYQDVGSAEKIENVNFILRTNIYTTGDCDNPNTTINPLTDFFKYLNKEQVFQEYASSNICKQRVKKYIKCSSGESCGDENCYGIKLDGDSDMLKRDMLNVLPYSNYILNIVNLDIPQDLEYRCDINDKGNVNPTKINKTNKEDVTDVDDPRLWAGCFLLFLGIVSFVIWIFLIKHFRTMKGKSDAIRIFGITISTGLTITLIFGGSISLASALTERYIMLIAIVISSVFAVVVIILEIVFVSKGYKTEKEEEFFK